MHSFCYSDFSRLQTGKILFLQCVYQSHAPINVAKERKVCPDKRVSDRIDSTTTGRRERLP